MKFITNDQLAAARQRGIDYATGEWERPDSMTLEDAATYSGRSEATINFERQNKKLYALALPGREHGYRYPRWQFDVDRARLETVLQALNPADAASCWIIHNFLTCPHSDLNSATPVQIIADSNKPLDLLLRVIEERFAKV